MNISVTMTVTVKAAPHQNKGASIAKIEAPIEKRIQM